MLLKSLLSDAIASFPENKWPTYDGQLLDRSEFLTSSEVAGCLRKAFFAKNADDYPHQTFDANGFTERGHAVEEWLVQRFRNLIAVSPERGIIFQYLGDDQRSFYDADRGLSGTPDGLLIMPDGEHILVEFKSFDPRSNTRNFPKEKHRYQCIQNMWLVNNCLKLEGNNKIRRAMILYVNASDFFDQYEFQIDYDEEVVEKCFERADKLWEAADPEAVEAEGIYNGDCEYCKATAHCSACVTYDKLLESAREGAGNFSPPLVGETGLSSEQFEALAEFIELKNVVSQAEKMLDVQKPLVYGIFDQISNDLKAALVLPDGRTLTREIMAGRETIDKKALIAAGYNLDNFTKIGAPFAQLTFSRNKGNGKDAVDELRAIAAEIDEIREIVAMEKAELPPPGETTKVFSHLVNETGEATAIPRPRRAKKVKE